MNKSNVIEIIIYTLIIIVGIIMLFVYKPKEIEYEIPKNFEIIREGSSSGDSLSK